MLPGPVAITKRKWLTRFFFRIRKHSDPQTGINISLQSSVLSKNLVMVLGAASPEIAQNLMEAGACGVCQLRAQEILSLQSTNGLVVAALLTRESASRIGSRPFLQDLQTVLLPLTTSCLRGIVGLIRYGLRGKLVFGGLIRIGGSRVAAFHPRFSNADRRYSTVAPRTAKEIGVAISGLDAVMLHDVDTIEFSQCPPHVDVLASREAAGRISAILAEVPAVPPIRVFTADGSNGFRYGYFPYLSPPIGTQIVKTAVYDRNGISIPSDEWRLACRAFRLMFIDSAGIVPGTELLSDAVGSKCIDELARYAGDAGQSAPTTFTEIEDLLRAKNLLPALDGFGARSDQNLFLRERYWRKVRKFAPGLTVIMVRDFGVRDHTVRYVRGVLLAEGLEILAEKPVASPEHDIALLRIRGGEWSDLNVASGWAPMIHAFACRDPRLRTPSLKEIQLNFRLDNGRVFQLKKTIRLEIGKQLGIEPVNGSIHSTDNSAEAADCIDLLGFKDDIRIRTILQHLELLHGSAKLDQSQHLRTVRFDLTHSLSAKRL